MDFQQASAYTEPQHLLRDIASRFDRKRVAISFSGAEDVVLIDMAHRQPRTRERFAEVDGVGAAKLEQFAEPFLAVINAAPTLPRLQGQVV